MIPTMVTVHISLPEPPGERGRKLEYFVTKPRHKIVAPLMLVNSAAVLVGAWFSWRSQAHGIAVLMAAMSLVIAVLAAVVWRQGKRQAARLRQGIRRVT